jgi:hypothetical protein
MRSDRWNVALPDTLNSMTCATLGAARATGAHGCAGFIQPNFEGVHMRNLVAFGLAATMSAGTFAMAPAQAAPSHLIPSLDSASTTAHVQEVKFRRGHGRHHHRHHGWSGRDALIGLGIGAVAGGIIASQPYGYGYGAPNAYGGPVYGGPAYADASGWERCQAEFRSLRADGTYTTYGGEQKLCPYLR